MDNLEISDYVVQKGTKNPVGIIENIRGDFVTVRWGTADKRTFRDDFRYDQLEKISEKIYSPDEVTKKQAEEAGGKIIDE